MTTIASQSVTRQSAPSLRRLIAWWQESQAARRERNRIVREMNAYTDHELAELGFDRLDIWAVATGRYRR